MPFKFVTLVFSFFALVACSLGSKPALHDSHIGNKNCDGAVHGSAVTGFMQPTSPSGAPCVPATKTCINGVWTGPEVFPSCSNL